MPRRDPRRLLLDDARVPPRRPRLLDDDRARRAHRSLPPGATPEQHAALDRLLAAHPDADLTEALRLLRAAVRWRDRSAEAERLRRAAAANLRRVVPRPKLTRAKLAAALEGWAEAARHVAEYAEAAGEAVHPLERQVVDQLSLAAWLLRHSDLLAAADGEVDRLRPPEHRPVRGRGNRNFTQVRDLKRRLASLDLDLGDDWIEDALLAFGLR